MQYRRTVYQKLGSDIFALVCLFEYDNVFYCDPEAVVDMKVVRAEQFPKDVVIFSKVGSRFPWKSCAETEIVCSLWP